MWQVTPTETAAAFQAASGINAGVLGTVIVALTSCVVFAWTAHYIRRVMTYGFAQGDLIPLGVGLMLSILLITFVFATFEFL